MYKSLHEFAALYAQNEKWAGTPFLDKLETTSENLNKTAPLEYIKDVLNASNVHFDNKPETPQAAILRNRANSKHLSQTLAAGLLQLPNPHNAKAYANTFFCAGFVIKEDDRYKSKYCHNRWCLVCNRIKTAYLIDKYTPHINQWKQPYFVTLTAPNVKKSALKARIEEHLEVLTKIKDRMRKQGEKIVGIRKLETTYNPDRNDYHPHIHLIVESEAHARQIRDLWLIHYPESSLKAQDIEPATAGSIKELFKYFTKITSDSKNSENITLPALDAIFEAVKGRRVFQSFGFNTKITEQLTDQQMNFYRKLCERKAKNESLLKISSANSMYLPAGENPNTAAAQKDKKQIFENEVYFWNHEAGNWINHGELLSNYQITGRAATFKNLLIYTENAKDNRINPNRANHNRNANTNRRKHNIREKMVKGRTRPEKDFLPVESIHNVQT